MMRWSLACMFGLALAVAAAGCRSCDRVEAELRAREKELHQTKDELDHTRAIANGLQAELNAAVGVPPPILGDPLTPAFPIRALTLGRQTGGREDNYGSGDQALQVVVEPHDAENQVVKIPGSLLVTAVEITPEGTKRPLSTWDIPGDQLRRSWQSGLLTNGYVLVLPWKTCPNTEKLRVVAQFKVPDGRVFEADKDVVLHLPPAGLRPPPAPPLELVPPPAPLPETDVLPLPHRVEPSGSGPSISNKPADAVQRVGGEGQPAWRVVEPRP